MKAYTLAMLIFKKFGAGRMEFACQVIASWLNAEGHSWVKPANVVFWCRVDVHEALEVESNHSHVKGNWVPLIDRSVEKSLKRFFGGEVEIINQMKIRQPYEKQN